MAYHSDNWMRVFDISETSKHIKGFTLYKIISIVYPKNCPDAVTKITVWKRFNDFKKLYRDLKLRHKSLQIEDKYPTLPNSSFFKRFDAEIIIQRKNAALSFLEYVAQHPSLFKSNEFVKFFETSHTPQESLNSNISIIRAQLNLPNDPEIIYSCNSDDDLGQSDSDSLSTFSVASTSTLHNEESLSLLETKSVSSQQIDSPINNINNSDDSSKISLPGSVDANSSCKSSTALTPPLSLDDVTQNQSSPTHYLTNAAEFISKATEFELDKKYEESFTAYKSAISYLLDGVKEDTNSTRRQLVKYKIEKYLLRAEKIYNLHLSPEIAHIRNLCKNDNDGITYTSIKRPVEDLFNYKVLKLVGNGMVVLHRKEHNVYYMKVIQKSLQITESKYFHFPKDVPYMVKLFQYYDSPNAIFIVTQYVSGESLLEYIKQKSTSTNSDDLSSKILSITFEKDITDLSDRDFDETYSDSSEYSYSDLINDYTSKKTSNSQSMSSISKSEKISNSDTEALSNGSTTLDDDGKENSSTHSNNHHKSENGFGEIQDEHDSYNGVREIIDADNDIVDMVADRNEVSFQRSLSERSYVADIYNIQYIPPLEDITKWAAQLLLAIEKLHKIGIIIYDLSPNKLLLDEEGNLLLTFISSFREKGKLFFSKFENNLYCAPEVFGLHHATAAADWWSYGVVLYEILCGMTLKTVHPDGINNYTLLKIPKYVPAEAKSLLRQLLVFEPLERLGCGINGTDDLKSHPFYNSIDWMKFQVDAFKIQ